MRTQKIERRDKKKQPVQTIDQRQPRGLPKLEVDPAYANQPVRAVVYVEVGDADYLNVQMMVQEVNQIYDGARGGIHYVIPVRHGKLTTDIMFEAEFRNIIDAVCEVKDGEIRLKDGAKELQILRQSI